jgi:hypothetical protein
VANSQDDIAGQPPDPDLLAAVVLHVLVSEGSEGITLEHVARICERDPEDQDEHREVQAALDILIRDELAVRESSRAGDGVRFRPTRAAVRAAELSF